MEKRGIKNYFKTKKNNYKYYEIYNLFANSKYGRKLNKKIRYQRYKPIELNNNEWEKLLGFDVNNLKHHLVVYNQTKNFINEDKNQNAYPINHQTLLLLTSINHDWGESIVGDVMFDLKDEEHEIKEEKAIKKIFNELIFSFNDKELNELFNLTINITKNRQTEKNDDLSHRFNMIERLGFLETGINAWNLSTDKNFKNQKNIQEKLQWLTNNVMLNQISELVSNREKYLPIRKTLANNQEIIDNIFKYLPENIFDLYHNHEIDKNKQKYTKAKEDWNNLSNIK